MIFNFIHSLLNSKIEQTVQVAGIFSWLAGNDNIPDYSYNDLLHEMENIGITSQMPLKSQYLILSVSSLVFSILSEAKFISLN